MNTDSVLHAYQMIPLNVAGYILGAMLVVTHTAGLLGGDKARAFVKASPRNDLLAQITLAIGFIWFFLLIGPEDKGIFSSLRVELAEFEGIRTILQLACPVFFILLVTQVKELLFARALGFLGLMTAAPFLTAAFLKDPSTRLLIPIWGYALIACSLIWIAKPYVYRNMVDWATATAGRWKLLCMGGLSYGIAVLTCAWLWW